jgi:hypothetical protein
MNRHSSSTSRKRSKAVSFLANCPPERRAALTAEDVTKVSGLSARNARKVLDEMRERFEQGRML